MTMRTGDVPIDVEASTKDSSLTARVCPRMKRANPGAKTMASARAVSFTELPSTATTASASTSGGKASPASVARMRR